MPKKKLITIAEEYDVEFQEALEIATNKLPEEFLTGKGKNTWVSEEGQKVIEQGMFIDEIIPKQYKGKVIRECPNPRYNSVYAKEIGKCVPVLLTRQVQGKLVGKMINFEAIEDVSGVTYRYVKA